MFSNCYRYPTMLDSVQLCYWKDQASCKKMFFNHAHPQLILSWNNKSLNTRPTRGFHKVMSKSWKTNQMNRNSVTYFSIIEIYNCPNYSGRSSSICLCLILKPKMKAFFYFPTVMPVAKILFALGSENSTHVYDLLLPETHKELKRACNSRSHLPNIHDSFAKYHIWHGSVKSWRKVSKYTHLKAKIFTTAARNKRRTLSTTMRHLLETINFREAIIRRFF